MMAAPSGSRADDGPDTDTAEQATAGALLLAAPAVRAEILGIVRDDDILDARVRFVVTTIRAMVDAGVPVDEVTVADYIRTHGLLGARLALGCYLHDLAGSAPIPLSGPWYARAVVEGAARRRVQQAADRLAAAADSAGLGDLQAVAADEFGAAIAAIGRAVACRG